MEIFGGGQHSHNVRYQLAKGEIDQLFLKWVSQSSTDKLLNNLLSEI